MTSELIKLLFQLVILGILGGAVSWYYSKVQKNREIKIQLIKEFSEIQGNFLKLRFEYNTFHLTWKNKDIMKVAQQLTTEQIIQLKWEKYETACGLLGDFQSIKPLLIEFFPKTENKLHEMHETFQEWRRRIREDNPIFQTKEGKTHEKFKHHRKQYSNVISLMRKKI